MGAPNLRKIVERNKTVIENYSLVFRQLLDNLRKVEERNRVLIEVYNRQFDQILEGYEGLAGRVISDMERHFAELTRKEEEVGEEVVTGEESKAGEEVE